MKKYVVNEDEMRIICFDDEHSNYYSHGEEHYVEGKTYAVANETYEEAYEYLKFKIEKYLVEAKVLQDKIDVLEEKYEEKKRIFNGIPKYECKFNSFKEFINLINDYVSNTGSKPKYAFVGKNEFNVFILHFNDSKITSLSGVKIIKVDEETFLEFSGFQK